MTALSLFLLCSTAVAQSEPAEVNIRQITFGPNHHFFGYIGQCRTIPWNASGRYILSLRTDFQDRMPTRDDAAEVVLLDTTQNYNEIPVDRTRAWNFQQGTMFYWNPAAPDTQFFFNDRDPTTGKVLCVLYDINGGLPGRRIREYRFDETPIGNSGVAQNGGYFLGINYGRLARLRPVTGYPETFDWTVGLDYPEDDGIFKVDVTTGEKTLLISFKQLRDTLALLDQDTPDAPLFINHTLWSRDDDLIYFYARGNFDRPKRVNTPFTMRPDGSELTPLAVFVGGHPEWAPGHRIIGCADHKQVVYDVDARKLVQTLGDESVFPDAEGDIALSPDATWLANGYRKDGKNAYVFYRMSDGFSLRSKPIDQAGYTSGNLRIDGSPCWNRGGNAILFPSLADDPERTRQLFIAELPQLP